MAKFQSPLLGYNSNIRHKNRVFHIQTEDSGVNHPHIITHLFMDGGRILKSVKKSYAEYVGVEGMSDTVRGLMKEQHKAMFIALRDGRFDALVEGGSSLFPKPSQAPTPAAGVAMSLPPSAKPSTKEVEFEGAVSVAPITTVEPARFEEEEPQELGPATIDESRRRGASIAPAPSTLRGFAAGAREPAPSLRGSDAEDAVAVASSSLFKTANLPPPPKNATSKKTPGDEGAYRAAEVEPARDSREESSPRVDPRKEPSARARTLRGVPAAPSSRVERTAQGPSGSQVAAPPRSAGTRSGEPRYASARPAAIFGGGGSQRPPPSSIFSDDLVCDKSLDEVILSYLAEDLDPPRRK